MQAVYVSEIAVDDSDDLLVYIEDESFEYIYRAAMGVRWDPERRCLYALQQGEWSHLDWYRQIRAAVLDEYGCALDLTARTRWTNVSDDLRREIEQLSA